MPTQADILKLIEPVDPDRLTHEPVCDEWHLGWWEPWPMMELYLLERTEGITIARKYLRWVDNLHFLFVVIWLDREVT